MSKQVALAAKARAGTGKGEARSLRRGGRVPAVAYGTELTSTAVSVDGRELFHALNTDAGLNAIIRLDIEGQEYLTIARELHRHPIRRDVLHVDFVAIDRNRTIQVDVPIRLMGEAPGASEGGVVEQPMYTLSVEVLPLSVPDEIELDIGDMDVGDVKRVADLQLPEGVRALDSPDRTVVSLTVPALEVPEPEAPLEEVEAEFAEVEGEAADAAEADEEQPAGAGGGE